MFASSKFVAVIGSIALVASAGSAATPEFQSNGRTAQVRHGDLDLSTLAGQKQLRHRIARAASSVCVNHDLVISQACKIKAVAQVMGPVNAAIARAGTGERYADASARAVVPVPGN